MNEKTAMDTLEKVTREICHHHLEQEKREKAFLQRVHDILDAGGKELDLKLESLGDKLLPCCPLRPGAIPK